MTTLTDAYAEIKQRIEDNTPSGVSVLRWQNEDGEAISDTPENFIYTEIVSDPAYLAGFGGGSGANLWRNPARIECFCFVPRGMGLAAASDIAEAVATLFRGYRSSSLQCFDATIYPLGTGSGVQPPGLQQSEVDNYYCAVCEIAMHYDLIG